MNITSKVRKWMARTKHAAWAMLFLSSYTISMIAPFVPAPVARAYQSSTHEVVCHRLGNGESNAIPPDQQSAHIPKHVDTSDLSHSDYIIYATYPDDAKWSDLQATLDAKCMSEDPAPPKNVTAPTYVDVCGTVNDKYTIPTDPYATYKVNGITKAAGTYSGSGTINIVAVPKTYSFTYYGHTYTWNYELIPPTSWTFSFSNLPCTGSITIVKDAKPNSSTDFSFTTTGSGLSSFSLDDDSNPTLSNTKSFNNLSPGSYSVTENDIAGWDFGSITCTGGDTSITGKTVSIGLVAGANVSCTYTNYQRGKIIVSKITNPANDPTNFPINISGTGVNGNPARSLSTTNPATYDVAQNTTYSVSEDLSNLSAWKSTDNTCTNLKITEQTPLEYGVPTLHCTITNTKQTTLTLVKQLVKDNGGTASATDWTLKAQQGQTSIVGVTGSPAVTNVSVAPGTYSLSEFNGPDGYTASNWVCNGGYQSGASVTLSAGQNVTCTITNDDKPGTLIVKKHVVNDNGSKKQASDFTMKVMGTDVSASSFAGSEAGVTVTLDAGAYSVDELSDLGYQKSLGYGCYGNIKNGETKTCVITNNDRPVTITGHKKIANTDMSWVTQGMNPVNGWTIYLDQNQNGKLDNGEKWTKTDSNGYYSFTGLNANTTYYVKEVMTSLGNGWAQITAPAPVLIESSGGLSANNDFKNQAQGTITVIKNVDDGFGHVSKDVKYWTWSYDGKQQDKSHIATGSNNTQTVPSGTYKVREDQKPGYHVVASSCTNYSNPYDYNQYSFMNDKDDWNYDQHHADEELWVKVGLGENITCTFTNKRDTGTITVHKKIGNKWDPRGWTWWLEDNGKHNDMGDTVKVTTGNYWFGENQQHGYSFESLKCKNGRDNVWVWQDVKSKVYVGKDDHVECTFTNSRDMGSVTVVKDAQPDSSQGFVFTIEPVEKTYPSDYTEDSDNEQVLQDAIVGQPYKHDYNWQHDGDSYGEHNPTVSFTLVDSGDEGDDNARTTSLPTGKYRISETEVSGWDLTNISCGESRVEIEDNVVYLYVTKGSHVTCTFTNTKRAQLTIIKDAQPNSSKSFAFTSNIPDGLGADTAFNLTDDGTGLANSKLFSDLKPGTYTITESAVDKWKLDDISCTGTGLTMTKSGLTLTVTLAAGAVASCTFVNSFIPQVLADTTTLADTGASGLVTTIVALTLMGIAVGLTFASRKQLASEKVTK